MQPEYDVVVVGQGLAGTILSQHLLRYGYNVAVIDEERENTSSRVAAGIYNPVTGKRMVKSWMADELMNYAMPYYDSLEQELGIKIRYQRPVYRIFATVEEQNYWTAKSASEEFKNMIEVDYTFRHPSAVIKNELGGFLIKQAGYVELGGLLDAWKNKLKEQNRYKAVTLDINSIKIMPGYVQLSEEIKAKKVIFCEGYKGNNNPYFGYLPFQFSKGEVLELSVAGMSENYIVNGGVWIMPHNSGNFKSGSTYYWDDETEVPTERGKADITEKLNKFLTGEYTIEEHKAGIRPTVNDRRPFIGFHPKYPSVGIFNGLGTKGVMLAPFFARHFCEHIKNNTNLLKEVSIERYGNLLPND